MEKINKYVESIYKNFDETDDETKILKEETISHLYDEVEELKKHGMNENDSINTAILNFGEEKVIVKEMNNVLKRKTKLSKVITVIALGIYLIGCIFKGVNFTYDYLNRDEKELWENYPKSYSYIRTTLINRVKDKDTIDDNLKNKITEILDEFNKKTNTGIYYLELEYLGEKKYGYEKEVSEDLRERRQSGSCRENNWIIYFKSTDLQVNYDSQLEWEVWNKTVNSVPKRLNSVANYFFIAAWILLCVGYVNRAYISEFITKKYVAFFIIASIIIFSVAFNIRSLSQRLTIIVVGVMMLLSFVYYKYCHDRFCEKMERK